MPMALFSREVKRLLAVLENREGRYTSQEELGAVDALGERRERRAVEPLMGLLRHGDPDFRGTVARALGAIGDEQAVGPLEEALDKEDEPQPAREMVAALATLTGRPEEDFAGSIPPPLPPLHPLVEGAFQSIRSRIGGAMWKESLAWVTSTGPPRALHDRDLVAALLVPIRWCLPRDDAGRQRWYASGSSQDELDLLMEAVAVLQDYVDRGQAPESGVTQLGATVEAMYSESRSADPDAAGRRGVVSVAQGMAALGYVLGITASWVSDDEEAVERLLFNAGREAAEAVAAGIEQSIDWGQEEYAAAEARKKDRQREEFPRLLADLIAVAN